MQRISGKHKKNKKELAPLYSYIRQTERNRKKEYEHFLEHKLETLSVPVDIMTGQPMIQMNGTHTMRLLGTYRIGEYSAVRIVLQMKRRDIIVEGEQMHIRYFRKDEIVLVGNILNISFCE